MNNKKNPITVFIFPSKNKNNKYINLLTDSIRNSGLNIRVPNLKKDNIFRILYFICFNKIPAGKNIIHIQWSTVLYGSRFAVKSVSMLFFNIMIILMAKKILKIKIIWTVHNFFAHDYPHPILDRAGRKLLRYISDTIIVQQKSTLSNYNKKYPLKNVKYIPHGNYIDAYGPIKLRDQTFRRSFGFKDGDIVLLSFGVIAPYKLNESIIRFVTSFRKKFPRIKLLIVGKGKNEYIEYLQKIVADDDGIFIRNLFVPDHEVSKYLSIADYSIFYYDDSEMTSGGIILSLSYGIPVISRDIPGAEMIDDHSGLVFHNEEGLKNAINDIVEGRFEKKNSDYIIDSVRDRESDWKSIAIELSEIYRQL